MMNTQNDIDGGTLPQNYDDTPSAFTQPAPGEVPADAAPMTPPAGAGAVDADGTPGGGLLPQARPTGLRPFGVPADAGSQSPIQPSGALPAQAAPAPVAMAEFHAELTPQQLITIGSNINRGMTQAGQQIVLLQRGMVCGAVALGFLLMQGKNVASRHKMPWKKCFITRGAQPAPGQFPFSYSTGEKYWKTAYAVWERAAAAGKAHDLCAQVAAYLQDAMTFDAPARGIPVLGELIDTDAISVAQVMVELGIIKPGKHAALPAAEEEQAPVLPGLEDLMAQSWEAATRLVGGFRMFMENDVARLNAQQRGTLRQELRGLLDELDRIEKAAPGL